LLDAERMDGLDSSAQRQRAKVVGTDFGGRITEACMSPDRDREASADAVGALGVGPGA